MPFWRRGPRDEDPEPVPTVLDGAPEPADPVGLPIEPVDDLSAAHVATVADEPPPLEPPSFEAAPLESTPGAASDADIETPLADGLRKSRFGFVARLRSLLGGEPSAQTWEDVEETLIAGDIGATLAMAVVERARHRRDMPGAEAAVRAELTALLVPRDVPWTLVAAPPGQPAVVLMVGVNGTGKTTTIGKLAARLRREGRTVLLAAADTFRAAAIDQLRIWADRAGVAMVAHAPGADPAAVVYDALDAAVARGIDVVIADTAGRLHTKSNLMDELAKVRRVIDRRLPGAQPEVLFVLDATTGQNGLAQARAFHESTGLTGLVLTKLDSTARGGIVFAIEDSLRVPVRFVGVGEKVDDLLPFDPDAFVAALFA
jgi:fused signal recognition particle receptor